MEEIKKQMLLVNITPEIIFKKFTFNFWPTIF